MPNQPHNLDTETSNPSSFSPWRIVSIISRPRPTGTAIFFARVTPASLRHRPLEGLSADVHIVPERLGVWRARRSPYRACHRPPTLQLQREVRTFSWTVYTGNNPTL